MNTTVTEILFTYRSILLWIEYAVSDNRQFVQTRRRENEVHRKKLWNVAYKKLINSVLEKQSQQQRFFVKRSIVRSLCRHDRLFFRGK